MGGVMSVFSDSVKIVEVGPRDGLQNEAQSLSVADRIELIKRLKATGLKWIEGGSFVSPKAIPQMAESEKVFETFKRDDEINLSFLVPNEKGLERALEAGVKSIAVFTATSDTFTQKNIGMSVLDSLEIYRRMLPVALEKGLQVRGYISTAFGCPYEGSQNPQKLYKICKQLLELGCYEISVGDTIGVAHPVQVKEIFFQLQTDFGLERFAGHFHDTRGMAIVNVQTALDLGLRVFDASVGGLGGCPYAQGSSGNLATEELVWLLHGQRYQTGVDLTQLLQTAEWVEGKVGRPLKSKLYLAKPHKLFYHGDS
jgi:hydroxymethylglutaryl-CoA lyase